MEDSRIIELYWQRSENAITETDKKYGAYCSTVAFNILQNKEDAEESVNDTWLGAWDAIPPNRPSILRAFLAKITRNLPDATVDAIDLTNRDEYTTVPVLITDLEVTNTGLRFKYDYQEGNYDVPAHIDAILANGVSIGVGNGSGHPLEESGLLFCSYKWLVPIDLEEVTAINFNGIIIPIS